MKFSCERALLLSAIVNVSRAVPTRSSIAALEGILIEAGDKLRLTGFNLEIGITEELDAGITVPGTVVVGMRLLSDIVRRLPDDMVVFSLNDKMIMHIECGNTVFDISSCLEGSIYPQMPTVQEEKTAELPQKMLREMIRGTLFAVSDSDAKQIHTGSKFIWEENKLTLVSIDGYRLALRRETYEGQPPGEDFVVPGSALREVERLLTGEDEDTVRLVLGGRHILFEMGTVTLTTRLLEGEFLNYKTTIPTDQPVSILMESQALTDGIGRVSLLINEKVKSPVRLKIEKESITISCVTALGAAQDVCPAQVEGLPEEQALEIGFNNRYLLDVLHVLPDEQCLAKLANPLSPCVIVPQEGDAYLYMILPVRLRAD